MVRATVNKFGGMMGFLSKYLGIHFAHNNAGIEGEKFPTHLNPTDNFDLIMKVIYPVAFRNILKLSGQLPQRFSVHEV